MSEQLVCDCCGRPATEDNPVRAQVDHANGEVIRICEKCEKGLQ